MKTELLDIIEPTNNKLIQDIEYDNDIKYNQHANTFALQTYCVYIGDINCTMYIDNFFTKLNQTYKTPVNKLHQNTRIEDLAVMCGFMKSKGEARRNGYVGEVEDNYSEVFFGKSGKGYKYGIYIYKPSEYHTRIDYRYNRK